MDAENQTPELDKDAPRRSMQRLVRGRLYRGYRLINHSYYPPDRCVWWEAENIKTGEADFRATTRRQLKAEIDSANSQQASDDG
jgi:hypothetical protein